MEKKEKMAITKTDKTQTEPIHILTAEEKLAVEKYFAEHILPEIRRCQELSSKAIERVGHHIVS